MSRPLWREALAEASARLAAAGVPGPEREARLIARHVTGLSADALGHRLGAPVPASAGVRLRHALAARLARRPLSQITRRRAFWEHSFRVSADVLDPRPDSETLIAAGLEERFTRVLDLGTGTGCLLLSLLCARPGTQGLGTDASAPALAVAQANARDLGLAARAAFLRADWTLGVPGRFDLVVSNPPYIAEDEIAGLAPEVARHEPRRALTPGGDGLSAYRAIASGLPRLLSPQGRAVLEIGLGQEGPVAEILSREGLAVLGLRADLSGRPRAILAAIGNEIGQIHPERRFDG